MDAARMHALAERYAGAPSEEALSLALDASLPLCALIARRFSGRGVDYEDLYQVACLACVQAIRQFDPRRGLQFTTYLTPTLAGAVRNHIRDRGSLIKAPRALRRQARELARAREQFIAAHREEPTPRQLAQALGWSLAQVLEALAHQEKSHIASLDQTDPEGIPLSHRLPFWDRASTGRRNTPTLPGPFPSCRKRKRKCCASGFPCP